MKGKRKKSELRRLASKQGWYDAFDGVGPHPLLRIEMNKKTNEFELFEMSKEESDAYWIGFYQGLSAVCGDQNPFLKPKKVDTSCKMKI